MHSIPSHTTIRGIVLFGASVLLLAGATFAAGRLSVPPSAVANLDLPSVLERLTQRADMEAGLAAKRRSFDEELSVRSRSLEERTKAADAKPEAQRQLDRDEVALSQLQLREWALMRHSEVDREEALQWQNLYRSIQAEVARLAEADGYDYVMVYDGSAEFRRDRAAQTPLSQQVVDQIMRRRVIYAATKDDITEKLVIRMNNSRAAAPAATVGK
ncbi:MAG: hypothetical protein O2800_02670 [Planctomycetota bacterium]|nr:hypothetical protein [Planctomycetota bacterium]